MKDYPIGFWNVLDLRQCDPVCVEDWHDLGITQPMTPLYREGDDKAAMLAILDRADKYGMKAIVCDFRTEWRVLTARGEEEYRALFRQALDDFGGHPAVKGFFVGDEPDAPDAADAFAAARIQSEMAPALTPYLNLLPWFDWIGERMGTPALAPYLDRAVREGVRLLSYDCYTQMWEGDRGWDDYFNNLREYMLATKRLGVPFQTILLSVGHYYYRCPGEDDMRWQLSTAVAHGASGISWFYIQLPGITANYRGAPIDQFGQRTQAFGWLSAENRLFQEHCGRVMTGLRIVRCHHVHKAYGGMSLFEPYGKVSAIRSEREVPMILSEFADESGRPYWMVVNNSVTSNTQATVRFTAGTRLEQCELGNVFRPVSVWGDPIGARDAEGGETVSLWLAPGQLVLLRERRD